MSETYKLLNSTTNIPNTLTTIYTCPAATQCIAKDLAAVNVSGVSATIKLYYNGTADSNIILPEITIGAGETLQQTLGVCLQATQTLRAIASSSNSITLHWFGLEIV